MKTFYFPAASLENAFKDVTFGLRPQNSPEACEEIIKAFDLDAQIFKVTIEEIA